MALIQGQATVWEGQDVFTIARIVMADGTQLVKADISGTGNAEITRKVFDLSSAEPQTAILDGTLDEDDVIYDTYQTDAYWDLDATGYNFRDKLPGANLPTGGHKYRIQYSFVADGQTPFFGTIYVVTIVQTEPVP